MLDEPSAALDSIFEHDFTPSSMECRTHGFSTFRTACHLVVLATN